MSLGKITQNKFAQSKIIRIFEETKQGMSIFNKQLFAERLLMEQHKQKLSVRKAAKEIKISASTLSRLNNQQIVPDLETFYLCVKWIGIEMAVFFK